MSTRSGEILAARAAVSAGAPDPVVEPPDDPVPEFPLPPEPKGKLLPPEPEFPLPVDGLDAVADVVSVGHVACPMPAPRRRASTATNEATMATCPLWLRGRAGGAGGAG